MEHKESRAEKEYADFLYQALGPFTLLVGVLVCVLVLQEPIDLTDERNLACQLALTDEEVLAIVPPASRLLDKAKLSPRVRQVITSSNDGLALAMAVGAYVARLYSISVEYGRVKNSHVEQNAPIQQARSAGTGYQDPNGGYANFGSFAIVN